MATDALPLFGSLFGQILPLALGAALLLFAALHDVAARTIPNWTSLGLALLGLALRLANGQLLTGLTIGIIVFALSAFCWQRGWMGGGDVKLLAAAAIFVPPIRVGSMLLAITLAGGAVALIYLVAHVMLRRRTRTAGPIAARPMIPDPMKAAPMKPDRRPRRLLARIARAEYRRLQRGRSLPYASAIAAGTIFVVMAH